MRMHVPEPRRRRQPPGIHHPRRGLPGLADRDDPAVPDRDVPFVPWPPGPVEDRRAPNQRVNGHLAFLALGGRIEGARPRSSRPEQDWRLSSGAERRISASGEPNAEILRSAPDDRPALMLRQTALTPGLGFQQP